MMLGIFTQQKASLPAWLPLVGEEFEQITAEFSTAQAVTPGQGQAVDIAGIQIGKVTSVDLEDGHAVVGMDIEPQYMELIHPDASFLLRPKTGLNDMIVEIEPGSGKKPIEDGAHFTLAQTEPNTNLDAFLATLDGDTRQYIQLLVAGGAQGIGGRGNRPPTPCAASQPFVHYTAKLNKAVAARHVAPRQRDPQLRPADHRTRPPRRRDQALRHLLRRRPRQLRQPAGRDPGDAAEFPAALRAAQRRPGQLQALLEVGLPGADRADPAGAGLTPAFKATERLSARRRRRSATRSGPSPGNPPFLTHARRLRGRSKRRSRASATRSAPSTSSSTSLLQAEGSKQSYLFYLPWLNHDFNAAFNLQDAGGPVAAGLAMHQMHRRQSGLFVCEGFDSLPKSANEIGQYPSGRGHPLLGHEIWSYCEYLGEKSASAPPVPASFLIIAGFALSCFGILLFLWVTFGGPTPFRAQPYEVKVPFNEASHLAGQAMRELLAVGATSGADTLCGIRLGCRALEAASPRPTRRRKMTRLRSAPAGKAASRTGGSWTSARSAARSRDRLADGPPFAPCGRLRRPRPHSGLVDAHIHLDKALLSERAPSIEGTVTEACA